MSVERDSPPIEKIWRSRKLFKIYIWKMNRSNLYSTVSVAVGSTRNTRISCAWWPAIRCLHTLAQETGYRPSSMIRIRIGAVAWPSDRGITAWCAIVTAFIYIATCWINTSCLPMLIASAGCHSTTLVQPCRISAARDMRIHRNIFCLVKAFGCRVLDGFFTRFEVGIYGSNRLRSHERNRHDD